MQLQIKNVGPINEVNIDVKKYNILIGAQASGKSTIAKSIFLFKGLDIEIWDSIERRILTETIEKFDIEKIITIITNDLLNRIKQIGTYYEGEIKLVFNPLSTITYSFENEKLDIGTGLIKIIESIILRIKDYYLIQSNKAKEDIINIKSETKETAIKLLREMFYEEIVPFFGQCNERFIPSSRSNLFFNNKQNEGVNFDLFSNSPFLNSGTELSSNVIQSDIMTKVLIDNYSRLVTLGEYVNHEGNYYFQLIKNKKIIESDELSSGQKESLVIFNLLKTLSVENLFYSVIIEEPEISLFPAAQSNITKAIITFANQPKKENQVIITTHSPYVLSTINNLLYAGQLAEDKKTNIENLKSLVPENLWMKPSDFACYKIKDGVLEDLVITLDSGIKQIDQEYIDSISNVLIDEMNQLILIDPNDE